MAAALFAVAALLVVGTIALVLARPRPGRGAPGPLRRPA